MKQISSSLAKCKKNKLWFIEISLKVIKQKLFLLAFTVFVSCSIQSESNGTKVTEAFT